MPAVAGVTHSRMHKLKIICSHPARIGESRLDDSSGRKRAAHDRLDDLSHSSDGACAAGHDCERIARGIGCQSCQEPWQVAAGWEPFPEQER